MLTVDEDWGQASIFINLANRRYLKTVERGIGSLRSPIPILLDAQSRLLRSSDFRHLTVATEGVAVGR